MTKEQIKKSLLEKKSYFKKGRQWLADHFNCSHVLIDKCLEELKDEKRKYRQKELIVIPVKSKAEEMLDLKDITKNLVVKVKCEKLEPYKNGNKKNVLIIGDLHQPFTLPGYLRFCREQQEIYNCGTVIYIGDITDGHSFSYHEHDSEGYSPDHEYKVAIAKLKDWYYTFPEAKICIGNHDSLPHRKMFTIGLPGHWLKTQKQLTESPDSYDWQFHHEIDGVYYTHGTGVSGDGGAMKIANQNRQSVVIGHLHSIGNIKYSASYKDIIFAMTVGCGLDYKQYAFNYGRDLPAKPIISCGIVINGKVPTLIPMEL